MDDIDQLNSTQNTQSETLQGELSLDSEPDYERASSSLNNIYSITCQEILEKCERKLSKEQIDIKEFKEISHDLQKTTIYLNWLDESRQESVDLYTRTAQVIEVFDQAALSLAG